MVLSIRAARRAAPDIGASGWTVIDEAMLGELAG